VHVYRTKPRYYEVDQQGVVFNMWYLGYFDEAMTSWFDAVAGGVDVLEANGLDCQLVHAEIDWKAGARHWDDLAVEVHEDAVGTTSFGLRFRIVRDGEELATGRTVYVVIAADGSGKRPIPDDFRRLLTG
jgi:acyl-CoA thioester hydrolase